MPVILYSVVYLSGACNVKVTLSCQFDVLVVCYTTI